MIKAKQYSTAHLVWDFILVILTGGWWLLWLIIRALRSI